MHSIGTVLEAKYEIVKELGRGGTSTVYLAKDRSRNCYWAVKYLSNEKILDTEILKKEAEILSSLHHEDIPQVVEQIETGTDYFVVMDYIEGKTLSEIVSEEGPIKEIAAIKWVKRLCSILNYLHTARDGPVIYCDMKPSNIMITQTGKVKLIDFGIAKVCDSEQIQMAANIGTQGYAAPEQYRGGSHILDVRTDIYSLGATMFFLVTGQVPEKPPSGVRPIRRINSSLSKELEYIISKCTQDNPANRYQNCTELVADLSIAEQKIAEYESKRKQVVQYLISSIFVILFITLIGAGIFSVIRQHFYYLMLIVVITIIGVLMLKCDAFSEKRVLFKYKQMRRKTLCNRPTEQLNIAQECSTTLL